MEEEIIEEQDSLTNESDEYESPDSEFAIPEESQFACTMDAKMCPDG